MKEKITRLVDVKTIVTFTLTAAFVYLTVRGEVKPDIFLTIYSTVLGWYFGSKALKNKEEDKSDD